MSRGYSTRHHTHRRDSSYTPYVLVVVGVLTFCVAVLGPVAGLFDAGALTAVVTSGAPLTFDGRVLVVSGGLLVVSATTTVFGVLLLFVRLS